MIYTILADERPVAALEATAAEARELLKETWFANELAALKVSGQPLFKLGTRLRARPATEEEWIIYDQECRDADETEEIEFVYLISLDRE